MDALQLAINEITQIDAQIASLGERRALLAKFVELGAELGLEPASSATSLPKLPPLPVLPPLPLPVKPLLSPQATPSALARQESLLRQVNRPMKDVVAEACIRELQDAYYMKPASLVDALLLRGIEIGGSNKAMALSAILSKDGRFVPDRKYGWSLKKLPVKTDPKPAATGMGSVTTQGEAPDADSSDHEL